VNNWAIIEQPEYFCNALQKCVCIAVKNEAVAEKCVM